MPGQHAQFSGKIRRNNKSFIVTIPKQFIDHRILELKEYLFIVKDKEQEDAQKEPADMVPNNA